MRTIILIPARYASSRYPGKPLAMLEQPNGHRKSLIQMSYEAGCSVKGIDAVYVVTDDNRIRHAAEAFGAKVIMTSKHCKNGTERCSEALSRSSLEAELVVNLQGDAPLTPPWFIEELINTMRTDINADITTPVLEMDQKTYAHFCEDRKSNRVGGTTVVFDHKKQALYFSKEVIPFLQIEKLSGAKNIPVYHHVGVYAYRPAALKAYAEWTESPLEQLEGLEQLRFLENGYKIKCTKVELRGRLFWELNNPEDIERIQKALRQMK